MEDSSTDRDQAHAESQEQLQAARQEAAENYDILAQEGVQPIESLGETFDPNRHEAVETTEDQNRMPNEVTREYRKGYMLGDRLLRPARVEVNRT
jgi:molecular chaperone GrpE